MKHTECGDCKLREGDCGYHFKMDGETNYDIASLSACDQYGNCEFFKPKAKPQGDLISREALKNDFDCVGFNDYDDYNRALRIINNAPTVEQPTGEWLFNEDRSWICSICDYMPIENGFKTIKTNFCPNCGAKMKGGETNER